MEKSRNIFFAAIDAITHKNRKVFLALKSLSDSSWTICSDNNGSNLLHYIAKSELSPKEAQEWLDLCKKKASQILLLSKNQDGKTPKDYLSEEGSVLKELIQGRKIDLSYRKSNSHKNRRFS